MCLSVWVCVHIKHCQTLGNGLSKNSTAGVKCCPDETSLKRLMLSQVRFVVGKELFIV